MNELINLKEELDKIDNSMMNAVIDGYYNSRLKMIIGMWEKGKVIATFTGVKVANFLELERQTGRPREHLKRWYDLFNDHPQKKRYIEKIAKPKALAWAQKALQVKNPVSEVNSETDLFNSAISGLEKWVEKYGADPLISTRISIIENLIKELKNELK